MIAFIYWINFDKYHYLVLGLMKDSWFAYQSRGQLMSQEGMWYSIIPLCICVHCRDHLKVLLATQYGDWTDWCIMLVYLSHTGYRWNWCPIQLQHFNLDSFTFRSMVWDVFFISPRWLSINESKLIHVVYTNYSYIQCHILYRKT